MNKSGNFDKLLSSDPRESWISEQEITCNHEKKMEDEDTCRLNDEILPVENQMMKEGKEQQYNDMNSLSAAEKIKPDEVKDDDFIGMVKDDIIFVKGLLMKAKERLKLCEEQHKKLKTTLSTEEHMQLVEAYHILEQEDLFDEWYNWDTSKEHMEKDSNNQDR